MANSQVETVNTASEKVFRAMAALLVVAAFVAYYVLSNQGGWVRWGAFFALVFAAIGVLFFSQTGKQLFAYFKDSWREVQKMVWPSRRETMMMTAYVFGFVVVMTLILFASDKLLEWVIYDLILNWK